MTTERSVGSILTRMPKKSECYPSASCGIQVTDCDVLVNKPGFPGDAKRYSGKPGHDQKNRAGSDLLCKSQRFDAHIVQAAAEEAGVTNSVGFSFCAQDTRPWGVYSGSGKNSIAADWSSSRQTV